MGVSWLSCTLHPLPGLPSSSPVALPAPVHPPNGRKGGSNLLLGGESPQVNIPTSLPPCWAGPPPVLVPDCLWLSASSPGACLVRSYLGQRVGVSPSPIWSHPWICLGTTHQAGLTAILQAWLWSVGQVLGTRTIGVVGLPTPVDKRASPTAAEPEADTLHTRGEGVLGAGLPGLVWNMPWSPADPEAEMPFRGACPPDLLGEPRLIMHVSPTGL